MYFYGERACVLVWHVASILQLVASSCDNNLVYLNFNGHSDANMIR